MKNLSSLRRWGLAALAAAALLAATATGGSASGPTAAASAAKSVTIRNFAFHPGTLRVNRGARVAFTNASEVTHTATRKGSFDTGRIKPGKSVLVTFKQKGTFAYHCKIHTFMKGKIVVE